jgi:hypothetical protein
LNENGSQVVQRQQLPALLHRLRGQARKVTGPRQAILEILRQRHPLYTAVFCAAVGWSSFGKAGRPWPFPWCWEFSLMPKPGMKNVGCGGNSRIMIITRQKFAVSFPGSIDGARS